MMKDDGGLIMQKNIGTTDRMLRLAIALILLYLAWYLSSAIFLLLGLFTLYEAFAGWCVLYQMLGKNTCPIDKR